MKGTPRLMPVGHPPPETDEEVVWLGGTSNRTSMLGTLSISEPSSFADDSSHFTESLKIFSASSNSDFSTSGAIPPSSSS